MRNFAMGIEEEVGDEEIVGVVVGSRSHVDDFDAKVQPVISWQEARQIFDYDYDAGYGGRDCHAITLWTPTRVIFVGEYDGATWLTSVPRNPVPHKPKAI